MSQKTKEKDRKLIKNQPTNKCTFKKVPYTNSKDRKNSH